MPVIYKGREKLYWPFMKKGSRFIPATGRVPEGFDKMDIKEILKDLRNGEYSNRPKSATYVVAECVYVQVPEPKNKRKGNKK